MLPRHESEETCDRGWIGFKMADPNDIRKERSFPEIPGVPNRSELMKPLIFPNSQRGFKIFIYAVTIAAGLYCIFIPEYKGEHCFVPIRNWVHEQKGKLLRIRPEDEEYVKKRTAELAARVEMGTKQTVQDTEKETTKP